MSLVEFFFNGDYRESLLINKKCQDKIEDKKHLSKVKPISKIRKSNKFGRDYHLRSIQHEVDLLQMEILYGFIDKRKITKEIFFKFLQSRNAKNWTHEVLWERFKVKNGI